MKRTFYVNGVKYQESFKCPAGHATCPAFEYVEDWPNFKHMNDVAGISVFVGPVKNPMTVALKIRALCDNCFQVDNYREKKR